MKNTCIIVMIGLMTSYAAAADPQPQPESATITPCDRLRIEGTIESIDPDALQLVVQGTVVQMSNNTIFRAGRNTLALDDLEVGKTVAVVGSMKNNVLSADQVNVRYRAAYAAATPQNGQRRFGRHGAGRGWGQGQSGARPRGYGQKPRTAGPAQAGQPNWRRGNWCFGRNNRPCLGTFQSPKGRQGPGPNPTPCEGFVRIDGTITSIDAESAQLLVGDTIVQITDPTVIKMGRTLVDFDTLEVGQTVAVCGKPADAPEDTLNASQVSIRFRGRTAQPPPTTQ